MPKSYIGHLPHLCLLQYESGEDPGNNLYERGENEWQKVCASVLGIRQFEGR